MKKIRINYCDFWEGFDKKNNFFSRLLSKYYDVELSDNPDYVFCSVFSRDFLKYKESVRIFYTGEYLSPDFNVYDYAIGFDYLDYDDRYFRYPLYFLYEGLIEKAVSRGSSIGADNADDKTGFCSFVYSNDLADSTRKKLFDALSSYKQVSSGGRYLNNIGEPVESKLDFEKGFKFSIACENYPAPGYTTEKLLQSFASGGIPIYWGDPLIGKTFNTDSFINVRDFNTIEDMVGYVTELDKDIEKYKEKREKPILNNVDYVEEMNSALVEFLKYIFDQDKDKALRRNLGCRGQIYEHMLTEKQERGLISRIKNKIFR